MNEPIKAGDRAEVVWGLQGEKSPNIGLDVVYEARPNGLPYDARDEIPCTPDADSMRFAVGCRNALIVVALAACAGAAAIWGA